MMTMRTRWRLIQEDSDSSVLTLIVEEIGPQARGLKLQVANRREAMDELPRVQRLLEDRIAMANVAPEHLYDPVEVDERT